MCDITTDPWLDSADPRVRRECLERLPGTDDIVLVGVVHDHPASVYRARRVVAEVAPATLALELPPLAVPLAAHHATEARTPPTLGGEMSAAIQAADTDRVVGIDGPSRGFFRYLAAELADTDASLSTLRRTAGAVRTVGKRALASRIGATVARRTTLSVAVDAPTAYDTDRSDEPREQAADEHGHIRTASSMLQAFSPPPATAIHRRARERHMAARLDRLRTEGTVVAVVGIAHLGPIADHLRDAADE